MRAKSSWLNKLATVCAVVAALIVAAFGGASVAATILGITLP